MIEATDVNSAFYALRLLSHRLDISEIEVTDGEEYPASEFTRKEQEQALKIIQAIEDSESESLNQLPLEKTHFYRTVLADRIEELADDDLADAGYDLQLSAFPSFQEVEDVLIQLEEGALREQRRAEIARSWRDVLAEMEPPVRQCAELWSQGSSLKVIAEKTGLSLSAVYRKLNHVQTLVQWALTDRSVKEKEDNRNVPSDSTSTRLSH